MYLLTKIDHGVSETTPRCAVKHCVKLRTTRAYREACGRTLVVGTTPVAELADDATAAATEDTAELRPELVETLFLAQDADAPAGLVSANVLRVSPAVLAKLAGVQSAAGELRKRSRFDVVLAETAFVGKTRP